MSQVIENLLHSKLPVQPLQHNELAKAYAIRICQKVKKPDDYTHIIAHLIDEIDNLTAMNKTIALAMTEAKASLRKIDQLEKYPHNQVQAA